MKANAQSKVNDLTGRKFGRLSVLSRQGSDKDGKALWLCQCDCGSNPIVIAGKRLTVSDGPTRSCGCIQKENREKRRIVLEGQTFGLLNVLRYVGEDKLECQCQCGAIVTKRGQLLREGRATFNCDGPVCAAESDFIGPILSLEDARSRGLKHYSPGLSCDKGHRGSYLVSAMSCVLCHGRRTREDQINNPERHREYAQTSRARPEFKQRRNAYQKERRDADVGYRFANLIRTRIGKVLRTLKLEKTSAFNRSNKLRDAITELIDTQGLLIDNILSGEYELDHIIPLATWPWSGSHTANKLTEKAANSIGNLQFLTKEQHRQKTNEDFKKYRWREEDGGYEDHSEILFAMITEKTPLPEHLRGHEEIILAEIIQHREKLSKRPPPQDKDEADDDQ